MNSFDVLYRVNKIQLHRLETGRNDILISLSTIRIGLKSVFVNRRISFEPGGEFPPCSHCSRHLLTTLYTTTPIILLSFISRSLTSHCSRHLLTTLYTTTALILLLDYNFLRVSN